MREFLIKLSRMDRRYVFLGVALFTVVPFFKPCGLPVAVTRYTQLVFDEVDALKPAGDPTSKPILLSMDYDPGTLAELGPMAKAILRHIFEKKAKVIVLSFMPTGSALAQETLLSVAKEYEEEGIEQGVHFAFLGFNTPAGVVIQSIGRDIRDNYPKDTRGVPLDDMPLFEGVKDYQDIHIVIDLAGNQFPVTWIGNAVERHKARFAMGVTNVMAADFTPFIASGQSKGMLSGLRGAAEYEVLLKEKYGVKLDEATMGMDSQSATHFLILGLIILGNLGFFLAGRKEGSKR